MYTLEQRSDELYTRINQVYYNGTREHSKIAFELKSQLYMSNYIETWLRKSMVTSQDDCTKVSFAKSDKFDYSNPDEKLLITTSMFKFLKKFNGKYWDFTIEQIQSFSEMWSQLPLARPDSYKLEVVKGNDITRAYDDHNVGSCMSGKSFVNFYALNPDKVSMVTLRDTKTDQLRARALIWQFDDGTKGLDRIYPSDGGLHVGFLQNWAKSNDIIIRDGNGLGNTFADYKTVSNLRHDGEFPYVDSLYYGFDYSDNYICLSNLRQGDYQMLDFTDGDNPFEDSDREYCERCDNYCDEVNHTEDGYVCNDCLEDYVYIDDVSDYIHVDNAYYSDYYNNYITGYDVVWSEHHNSYLYSYDTVFSEHHEDYFIEDSNDIVYSEYDGDWYLKDDTVYSEFYNSYLLKEMCIFVGDDWMVESDMENEQVQLFQEVV